LGEEVEPFLSTFVNKVDRKGRVSVPATFRALLDGQRFAGIVVFRSWKDRALDGSGIDWMDELNLRFETLPQFSDERDSLARVLFGGSQRLPFDNEGRVLLPPEFAAHAGITENAAFVGMGRSFQIWEPGALVEHDAVFRERARQQGPTLPPLPPSTGGRRE
jgi:MraZ protein